jgi:hypothetical protein
MMPRQILRAYVGVLTARLAITTVSFWWDLAASPALAWLGWALVVAAGAVAGFGQLSLVQAAILSLPFTAIDFGYGLLMFAFDRGSVSPTWSPEHASRVFQGFLVASAFFAVLSAVFVVVGALGGRAFYRSRHAA